jgi:hypothetical protein
MAILVRVFLVVMLALSCSFVDFQLADLDCCYPVNHIGAYKIKNNALLYCGTYCEWQEVITGEEVCEEIKEQDYYLWLTACDLELCE